MKRGFINNRCFVAALIVALPAVGMAAKFDVTPAVQAELDRQTAVVAAWAADPTVVAAVKEQNRRGPMPAVDEVKWKRAQHNDPIVKQFQMNPAGEFLRAKHEASGGAITKAFLNAARGEKVAFVEKTPSYTHAGSSEHNVPLKTGRTWQGKPEFDASTQLYAVQVSVPVLEGATPIGSLVIGINLSHPKLSKLRKAQP